LHRGAYVVKHCDGLQPEASLTCRFYTRKLDTRPSVEEVRGI
jgi:hypothetical protein